MYIDTNCNTIEENLNLCINFSYLPLQLFCSIFSSGEMATIHSNIRRMKEQGSGCKNVLVPQLIKPLLITCGLMFFLR